MDCGPCNLTFKNKIELFKHFRTPEHDANMESEYFDDENDQTSDILLREQCEFVDELDKHYRKHNAGTSIDGYSKVRKLLGNLKRAEMLRHALIIRYMDDFNIERGKNKLCRCGKTFVDTENLINHQIKCGLIHGKDCKHCGKTFADHYILKTHKKKCIPKVDKDFKCEYCPKSYENKCSLDRHLKICKKKPLNVPIIKKEFECEFCPKSYDNIFSKKNHLKTCKFKLRKKNIV